MSFAKAKLWIVAAVVLLSAVVAFFFLTRSRTTAPTSPTPETAVRDNGSTNSAQTSAPESQNASPSEEPENSPTETENHEKTQDNVPPEELPATPDSSGPSPSCFFFTH